MLVLVGYSTSSFHRASYKLILLLVNWLIVLSTVWTHFQCLCIITPFLVRAAILIAVGFTTSYLCFISVSQFCIQFDLSWKRHSILCGCFIASSLLTHGRLLRGIRLDMTNYLHFPTLMDIVHPTSPNSLYIQEVPFLLGE